MLYKEAIAKVYLSMESVKTPWYFWEIPQLNKIDKLKKKNKYKNLHKPQVHSNKYVIKFIHWD